MPSNKSAPEEQKPGKAGAFSLSNFESMEQQTDGVWYRPRHPDTGLEIDWRLLIAGVDSAHYAEAMTAVTALRGKKQQFGSGRTPVGLDYSDVKDSEVVIACHITLDWEPLVGPDGKKIPCNSVTKAKTFEEHRWLADQVILFCRNRANFLPSSDA